jgi:hypothetical protein
VSEPTLLGTALAYARERGWPVFPLEPRGKEPLGTLAPHGFKDATVDQLTIRRWWKAEPNANIGIPTGLPETFDVGDFDDPSRLHLYKRLLTEIPDLSRILTGSGGRHVPFAPGAHKSTTNKSLDWRGPGGYIVAPGSLHPSGQRYRWLRKPNGQWPTAPGWLLEQLKPTPTATPGDGLAELLAGPPDDPRKGNAWMTRVLGHFVRKGFGGDDLAALARVIQRDLKAPLPAGDLDKMLRQTATWSDAFEQRVAAEVETLRVREEARRRQRSRGWSEPHRFDLTLDEEPEPEHLGVGGFLLAALLVWLFGEPETGKSVLASEAGVRELHAGRVAVHLDAEAGEADVRQKYRALGATAEELSRLYVYDVSGVDLIQNPGWLLRRCQEIGARLAVLDSAAALLAAAGLSENENAEVGAFVTTVLLPVVRSGVCVVVLDHVTKADPHSRYPRAAGVKLALSDLAYNASAPEPFARGRSGRLRLRCEKDRSGWVGRGTQFDIGVTASDGGRLELDATRMTPEDAAALAALEGHGTHGQSGSRLLAALQDGAKTADELEKALNLSRPRVSTLLNEAKARGDVTDEGNSPKTWRLA